MQDVMDLLGTFYLLWICCGFVVLLVVQQIVLVECGLKRVAAPTWYKSLGCKMGPKEGMS